MGKTEILSPCGTKESVISAINGGADAIYLGGDDFNARNSLKNFSVEDIREIVSLTKLYNVKVYLTVNTLIKDSEFERLIPFLDEMYKAGVYAFIIQEVGLIPIIKERYPEVKIHASTQMNCHSLLDILHLKELGFDRVVLAREVSLLEMKTIKENADIEIEVFVHGALCVSYSGQCLMSSLIGSRSGNRGKCAQPCRKKLALYDKVTDEKITDGYLLSPKDVKQTENIEELIKIGVDSFKIEGRMKSPEYVYQTTRVYKDKINSILYGDEYNEEEATKKLLGVFNRGGSFSTGYLKAHSTVDIMSLKTPKSSGTFLGTVTDYNRVSKKVVIKLEDDVVAGDGVEIWTEKSPHVGGYISKENKKGDSILLNIEGDIKVNDKVYKSYNKSLIDELKPIYKKITKKSKVTASFECQINKPFMFSVKFDDIEVIEYGEVVTENKERPLTLDIISEKLKKSGSTPFSVDIVDYKLDEYSFLALKNINEIRRLALEKLEMLVKDSCIRKADFKQLEEIKQTGYVMPDKMFSVDILDVDIIDDIIDLDFDRLYVYYNNKTLNRIDDIISKCRKNEKRLFVILPKISSTDTEILIDENVTMLKEKGVDGFVVSNYGQILMAKGTDIILDYNFNVMNRRSLDFLLKIENVLISTVSMESTMEEIYNFENSQTEILIHGKQVVMETRACPIGLYIANKKGDKYCSQRNKASNYVLRDKMNVDFPIRTNCDTCVCEILNGFTLFMLDKYQDLKKVRSSLRISISNETNPREVIDAYLKAVNLCYFEDVNESKILDIKEKFCKENDITKGHFYRGVE